MKRLNKVPDRVFWFLPMMSINQSLKEFYFGWLSFAYVYEYGKF